MARPKTMPTRQYDVYVDDELVGTYKHFNCMYAGADFRLRVDADLGVGPFYCSDAELDEAKAELARYLHEQWQRVDTTIHVENA